MKKQSVQKIAKQFVVTTATAFLLIIGSANSFKALAVTDKNEAIELPVQISYSGLQDGRVIFDVHYQNKEGKNFNLVVLNENNETLYSKKYADTSFNKKISFDKNAEETYVTISVRCGKKVFSETFKIKPQTSYVSDMLVTRL